MEDNRVEIHERIACLEVKINEVISNHLPHIEAKIERISGRLWWVLGTVVIGQLAMITLQLLK